MNVTLLAGVQGHVVALHGELGHVHEEPPSQCHPDCVHVTGAHQAHPAIVTELHQLFPDLGGKLKMSLYEELLLTPRGSLATALESPPNIQKCNKVSLVSEKFLEIKN